MLSPSNDAAIASQCGSLTLDSVGGGQIIWECPDTVCDALIDPFGGRSDIERKILRAVGDPVRRFGQDQRDPVQHQGVGQLADHPSLVASSQQRQQAGQEQRPGLPGR